jgi:lactoylglutathione lyase
MEDERFRIDHLSLCVRDLAASAKFYSETLGLQEVENKTRRPTIRWFAFDGHRAIHLITGPDEPPPDRPIAAHFCLSTTKFDETLRYLVGKGITHVNTSGEAGKISIRADGVRQTYFQDPDNYWIEVCEANPDGSVG